MARSRDSSEAGAAGGGRGRRPAIQPKGRQVDPAAVAEVRELLGDAPPRRDLLGDAPPRRDLLIEHLHRIQDRHGCLTARHLAALAELMHLAQAEVYEVATFYAHFDVVADGEAPPPPLTVRVCDSIACEMAGGAALKRALTACLGADVRVIGAPCVGACDRAPVAVVGRRQIGAASTAAVAKAAATGATEPDMPVNTGFDAYVDGGGYATLRALRQGRATAEAVLDTIEASGLRGLGGAGFPVARKARFVLAQPKPRTLVINADEGEPGTFKDRYCFDTDPHRVLEGALILATVVEAEAVYLYLRDEYPQARALLDRELARLADAGLTEGVAIHLRRGAGAYICGEESALLESLEGKRGLPRNRPPFPAQRGLFGRPTLIHNVETVFWLREIIERGADWYREAGRPRLYSVSGRVRAPGVKRAPGTVTARQLIDEHAGGMLDGHRFTAYLPGGASGGILPASLADLALDFGALEAHGCFVGSGAVVVLSDRDDIRAVVRNLLHFFEDESCGQCTPCRVGCEKLLHLIAAPDWDAGLIGELSQAMADASICGLGQAAPNPVLAALRFFPEASR